MTLRVLPNLVIVGAPKAGTTSLFNYLSQHSQVCGSDVKELDYFTPLRGGGTPGPIDDYAAHFTHWSGQSVVMEASPSYCYSGRPVMEAIESTLDAPRVLLSLREPAARLWSAYTSHRARGNLMGIEHFDDYVDRCLREREAGTDRQLGNRLIAASVGYYSEYVPEWLSAFGPRLRVVFAEQLADPLQLTTSLCRWLEIDEAESVRFDYSIQNRTRGVRSATLGKVADAASRLSRGSRTHPLRRMVATAYARANTRPVTESMRPETRDRLHGFYRQSNADTAAALHLHGVDDLPGWLEA